MLTVTQEQTAQYLRHLEIILLIILSSYISPRSLFHGIDLGCKANESSADAYQ